MAVLIIEKGKQKGQRYEVPEAAMPTVLGRDAGTDIAIDDERASRQHAQILRRHGAWVIEDLGSRNGILFQGAMVRQAVIKDREVFQIGSTVFKLEEDGRLDPLSGMEIQGTQLLRILHDEAGVLTYQGRQLAMDRPVRIDVLHPRWPLARSPSEGNGEPARRLVDALKLAARAAAEIQHPRVNPLLRSELPDEHGNGFAVLRWSEAPRLSDILPEFFKLSMAIRILCLRKLAEAMLARAADPLGYPIGLHHVLLDPEEGPLIQAIDLPALLALLKGQATHLPAFPDYLAPEHAEEGAMPSRPAVVYNLAAIGYRLLTGIPPMGEGTVEEILERHRSLPPAPADLNCPEVPAPLAQMLNRMLEKDPSRRPADREEILAAITAQAEGTAPSSPAAAPAPAPRESVRATPRRPLAAPAGATMPAMPPAPRQAAGPRPQSAARPAPPATGPVKEQAGDAPKPRPVRSPAPIPIPEPRKMPLLVQLIFWPALWCGLVIGGRYLMKAILEQMGR